MTLSTSKLKQSNTMLINILVFITDCICSMTVGYVFTGVCLFNCVGGPQGYPSPSHNTSTGPMSYPGCTPSPSHNTSTGPMSFFQGVLHLHPIIIQLVPGPFPGLDGGTPTPRPEQLCLDRLCRSLVASHRMTFLFCFFFVWISCI